MRKFHSIAALCGDGLRPELQALFDRLAIDPSTELFVRPDGMIQSGPDPVKDIVEVPSPVRPKAAGHDDPPLSSHRLAVSTAGELSYAGLTRVSIDLHKGLTKFDGSPGQAR